MIIHPSRWYQESFIQFYWKKDIELLTNKTYQEKIGFLAVLRNEHGFPQRKLKSMKGKQVKTIWARSGQAERRRREQLEGSGDMPPGKLWKFKYSETQSDAFL